VKLWERVQAHVAALEIGGIPAWAGMKLSVLEPDGNGVAWLSVAFEHGARLLYRQIAIERPAGYLHSASTADEISHWVYRQVREIWVEAFDTGYPR
jgi:hypothetical protein